MNVLKCTSCGSNELVEAEGVFTCPYCRSKFEPQNTNGSSKESVIEMLSDLDLLLKKCESDPANRSRYINLILDIDPGNKEVKKYFI
jgi:hypothetical protein